MGAVDYLPEQDFTPQATPLQDLVAKAKAKYDRPKLTQHELNMAGMRDYLQLKAFSVYRPRKHPTGLAPLPYAGMAWWKSRRTARNRCGVVQ